MQPQLRKEAAGQVEQAQVLDDERVRADARQRLQVLQGQAQFALLDQAVHGHVQPPALFVGVTGHGGDLGKGEIARQRPRVQAGGADVDRVRAGLQRRREGGQGAGRGEQFHVRGRGGGGHRQKKKGERKVRREVAYSAGDARASG